MAQRVLAVLGAIGLVLAAIAVRNVIDDGGSNDPDEPASDDEILVICDTDFASVCDALPIDTGRIVEDAALTSETILAGNAQGLDAWVTSDAWFEITLARSEDPIGDAEVLASSPVVIAIEPDRAEAVRELCADVAVWRCLGDHAGEPWGTLGGSPSWGPLESGLPDADTATGLSVITAVASGFFGNTSFATNDFDGEFRGWLGKLAEPAGAGDADPANTLVVRRGTYTAAGAIASRVAAITRPVVSFEVTPPATSSAVLVDLVGGDEPPDAASVRKPLVDAGWRTAAGEPTPLLKTGVMAALHTLWTEVAR